VKLPFVTPFVTPFGTSITCIHIFISTRIIVNAAVNSEVASVLGSVGVCQIISDVLQAACAMNQSQPQVQSLVQASCWAVRNLACSSSLNHSLFAITDLCAVLRSALVKFEYHAVIAESALKALANLCCSLEMAKRSADLDLTPVVLLLLRAHHADGSVKEAAMWVCRNFAAVGADNQLKLFRAGASEDIMHVLSSFAASEDIVSVALGAVVNLISESKEIKDYFVEKLQISELVVSLFSFSFRHYHGLQVDCKSVPRQCRCIVLGDITRCCKNNRSCAS
jgi:hypothetical protein